MAKKLAQKTFKIEFEITVEMEEVGQEHLHANQPARLLPRLQRLQQALLNDEPALLELMSAAALNKLQGYLDYVATQDDLAALFQVASSLYARDQDFFQKYRCDFADLTRPVRVSSLTSRLNRSVVEERTTGAAGETEWEPVWSDLLAESALGRLLAKMSILQPQSHPGSQGGAFAPDEPHQPGNTSEPGENSPSQPHYLQARYLTRQRDGVHAEARCTCEKVLEGTGESESQALEALWEAFREHSACC
jgi:hypothetical protein